MAELDTTDVQSDIKQQQVSLNNAQIKLEQLLNGPTAKDVLNAENAIINATSKITTLENQRTNIFRDKTNKQIEFDNQALTKANDIKNKQADLMNAKNELATLEKTQNKEISDTGTDIIKTLDAAIIDARKHIIDAENSIYRADEILGISDANRLKNDDYEMYIAAKNTGLRTQTETDWIQANQLLSEAKSLLNNTPQSNPNSREVQKLLLALSKAEDKMVTL
jgi:hypothetical protein